MWRALSNALPSMWYLFQRKIVKTPICGICGDYPETIEHCLFHCPWTLAMWFGCSLGYIPDRGRISHLEEWLLEIHKNAGMFSCEREDVFNLVCLHLWEIWKHKCSVIMRNSTPNPSLVNENIQRGILNWEEARMSMVQPSQSIPRPISLWVPPLVNVVKINFDGAWKESNHNSGLGIIICSHMGVSIAGASLFRSYNSTVEAEAKALLCGVKMAVVLKLEHIIVEGDCQEVIKALNESLASPCWRISPILKKVAHLVPLFRRIHWNWVPREANRLANAAAKLAIQSLCSQEWANRPPNSLINVLRSDGLPGPP
ncbi:PREDICTED: putative ribonuclease H protein At1g65750-like [Fragaria vesca subsp. vesca]